MYFKIIKEGCKILFPRHFNFKKNILNELKMNRIYIIWFFLFLLTLFLRIILSALIIIKIIK